MKTRADIRASRRWVIKIGSALLTNEGLGIDHQAIQKWVQQMVGLVDDNVQLVLVSSGAVAEGMVRLGWKERPHAVHDLQAAAAVGQMGLIQAYESEFRKYDRHTAQILLTHDDLADRKRYLNARSTLKSLLSLGVVPVVNENDTVTTDEIRFGDNDTLAALVANLIEAELLVILTDQEGMFDADPRINPAAQLLSEVKANDANLLEMAGDSKGVLGRGGMLTKVIASQRAARSGTATVICSGRRENVLSLVREGSEIGTFFIPGDEPMIARKRWLAGQLQVRGRLSVDAGAEKVLCQSGRSLLAVGVTQVEGNFARGELVSCVSQEGREIARGLVNYNSDEARKLVGVSSDQIEKILGYVDEPELINRDNLVLIQ